MTKNILNDFEIEVVKTNRRRKIDKRSLGQMVFNPPLLNLQRIKSRRQEDKNLNLAIKKAIK